jgi:hypothetical protein
MKSLIRVLARLLIAGTFLWAAFAKLRMGQSNAPPATLYEQWAQAYSIHYALIFSEVALAVWLLSNCRQRAATIAVVVVLSAFSGLLLAELGRDHPLPCGCMGAEYLAAHDPAAVRITLAWSLGRNTFLIGIAMAASYAR